MPTKIIMPQLGESVVEGTISRWLKQEGESIDEMESLLEVSTDKVDTEIPSPAPSDHSPKRGRVSSAIPRKINSPPSGACRNRCRAVR